MKTQPPTNHQSPLFHSFWALITALLIILSLHTAAIILDITPIRNSGRWDLFWDCDSYVWLKRALDFYQHGGWYNHADNYLSYPDPMVMHWTRPLDIILLFGGWLGSFFTDFKTAVEIWAKLLAPLLHLSTIFLISFAVRPFLGNRAYIVLIVLFALQRGIYNKFAAGQADNHPLLALGVVILFCFLLRYLHNPKRFYLTIIGITAGLLCWVSIEALVLLLAIIFAMGFLWLLEGRAWLKVLWLTLLPFAITISLALMIDRLPSEWLSLETDRLSFLQVGVIWILSLITAVLASLDTKHWPSIRARFLGAFVACASAIIIIYAISPAFFQGAHPWIHEAVKTMAENQPDELPYLPTGPYISYHFFIDMGPFIIALVLLVIMFYLNPSSRLRRRLTIYFAAILVFGAYTLYLFRGLGFLQIIIIFPWLEGLLWLYSHLLASYKDSRRHSSLITQRLKQTVLLLLLIEITSWHWQVAYAINASYNFRLAKLNDWRQYVRPWCQYNDIVPYITTNGKGNPNRTVLTDLWSAPELMYKTGYSIFYSPYHRNGEGINDGFMLTFARPNDSIGPSIAKKRKLKYIVYCRNFLRYASDSYMYQFPQGLAARLYRGETPNWLEPVALPENLQKEFVIYQTKW
jgi:hypothetical protein